MRAALGAATAVVLAIPIVVVALAAGSSPDASAAVGGFGSGLKAGSVPAEYEALVLQAGGICAAAPPSIVAAQIQQESGWNPKAVSSTGAEGIAQFLPTTWPLWAQPPTASPFDPPAAIPAMGRYDCALAAQMQAVQQQGALASTLTVTQLMLAAYNAGPAAVSAAGGIPDNGQTPGYVAAIIAGAANYANTTGNVPGTTLAAKIIAAAESQLGVPYAWDGGTYTGPTLGVCAGGGAENDCNVTGFDCSGLTMFALYQATGGRIQLTHYTQTQVDTDAAKYHAARVPRGQEQPGDLIAFTEPGASDAHHIAIYLGGGQIIQAPESGENVDIASLAGSYWQSQQWTVVRYS